MKRYSLSFAASTAHVPDHPERTATRQGSGMDFDVYYQVWPNRAAMLKTSDMQARAGNSPRNWKPWKGVRS